jgi:hypothetical protein
VHALRFRRSRHRRRRIAAGLEAGAEGDREIAAAAAPRDLGRVDHLGDAERGISLELREQPGDLGFGRAIVGPC